MKKKVADNSKRQHTKRKPTPASWKKGQSGNPRGAPKRGESWTELYKQIGNMTPKEASQFCRSIAGEIGRIGDVLTLKEAVVLRVFKALIDEPDARLLNAIMDRDEGRVTVPIVNDVSGLFRIQIEYTSDWRTEADQVADAAWRAEDDPEERRALQMG